MAFCAYCGSHVAEVSFVPCASCGNPTNGAPARPQGGRPTNPALIVVFVILGALVVVAILGILAAIAIPNLLTAMERSKQKRTMADMRAIAVALETYANNKGDYPDGAIGDLQNALVPTYSPGLPRLDGWTHELKYEKKEKGYVLASGGKDGTFERGSLSEYVKGTTSNFDCDIVLADGEFVQYPEMMMAGDR